MRKDPLLYVKHRVFNIGVLVLAVVFLSGCAAKSKINTQPFKPPDPVKERKNEFTERYGFFITKDKKVSYYQDALGVVGKESEIFKNLKTIEEVDKFVEVFMKVRDPDPNTSENEFKIGKDKLIEDIQSEALLNQGIVFKANGGLRGDMAHVYLLYGAPHQIEKTQNMSRVADLMAWVYFRNQKPLFVFLFYDKGFGYKLFKRYDGMNNPDMNNSVMYMERLREVAKFYPTSLDDYVEMERELIQNDPTRVFWFAIIYNQFSAYTDVVIEGGNIEKKIFGALDPPEPAALTAARYKPTVVGQPGDLTGREFLNNSYNSFIPAELRITKDNRPSFPLAIGYKDVDWEIKGENAEAVLDVRISFQNKATKIIEEFAVRFPIRKPREEVQTKRQGVMVNGVLVPVVMEIPLDGIQNFAQAQEPRSTLRQLIDDLEPGAYVVNVDLRHPVTKKYAGGWREEIIIK